MMAGRGRHMADPGRCGSLARSVHHLPARAALILAMVAGLWAVPTHAFYEEAEVRAILFSRDRADALGAPLVLLAHRSDYTLAGNGPRVVKEHYLWYVGDPEDPACDVIAHPRVLLNTEIETFRLKICRIYRGDDTLRVEEGLWDLAPPRDWPATGNEPFFEAAARMPALARGDIVELAYAIDNRWNRWLYPTDWIRAPLREPRAPTLERHVRVQYNSAMRWRAKVLNDPAKLVRHIGLATPTLEVLTGDLPPGPPVPTAIDAPCFGFSGHETWAGVARAVGLPANRALAVGEEYFRDLGDSLATAHTNSRERLQAVLTLLGRRCALIPEPMTATIYQGRQPPSTFEGRSAKPLEFALLVGSLARAAHLRTELFLARPGRDGLVVELPQPMQFDRVALRVLLAEEDRVLLLDPTLGDLAACAGGIHEGMLLIGLLEDWLDFYEVGADGSLERVDIAH